MSKLKGFQDLLPATMAERWRIISTAVQQGQRSGFTLIDTPTLEYYRTLVGDGEQGETVKQVYRFTDGGGRDVGLRFDLTVPFARFVAEHQHKLVFPFKRIQFGDVFRGEKPQMERGRFRQFCQFDFDIVGVDSSSADAEVIALAYATLAALEVGEFTIAINDRQITLAFINRLLPRLSNVECDKVFIAIDKLAKLGREAVTQHIVTATDGKAMQAQVEELLALLTTGDKLPPSEYQQAGVHDRWLRLVATRTEVIAMTGAALDELRIDLAIVRGLGYYTGIVFETNLRAIPELGSICSGGRYADLVSRFSSKQYAGVGGSIGVDRLASHLTAKTKPNIVMLAIAEAVAREYAYRVAKNLRSNGWAIDVDVSQKGLKQQLRYANRQDYHKVLIIGGKEADANTVTVRDMSSGTEQVLPLQQLLKYF